MTAPRIIVAGATTAITRRTTLRKAFLAPWHPLVPQIWLCEQRAAPSRSERAECSGCIPGASLARCGRPVASECRASGSAPAESSAGSLRTRGRDALRGQTAQMIDEVRAVVADEASELCAHAELDFEHRTSESAHNHHGQPDADWPKDAPLVTVRHRFARTRDGADASARRITVLRDRRRGRPPRHGADPPV